MANPLPQTARFPTRPQPQRHSNNFGSDSHATSSPKSSRCPIWSRHIGKGEDPRDEVDSHALYVNLTPRLHTQDIDLTHL